MAMAVPFIIIYTLYITITGLGAMQDFEHIAMRGLSIFREIHHFFTYYRSQSKYLNLAFKDTIYPLYKKETPW